MAMSGEVPFRVKTKELKYNLEDKLLVILASGQTYIAESNKLHCCSISSVVGCVENNRLTLFTKDYELGHILIDNKGLHDDSTKPIEDISQLFMNSRVRSIGTATKGNERFYHVTMESRFPNDGNIIVLDEQHNIVDINHFDSEVMYAASFDSNIIAGLRNGEICRYPILNHEKIQTFDGIQSRCKRIDIEKDRIFAITPDFVNAYDSSMNHLETLPVQDCKSLLRDGKETVALNEDSIYIKKEKSDIKKIFGIGAVCYGRRLNFIGRLDDDNALIGLTNGDYFKISFEKLKEGINIDSAHKIYDNVNFKKIISLDNLTGQPLYAQDHVRQVFIRKIV